MLSLENSDKSAPLKNKTTQEETRILQAEQARQLYAGLPSALVANPVIAGIIAYTQSSVVALQSIVSWLVALSLVILLRLMLYYKYRGTLASGNIDQAPSGWLLRFRVLTLATGAIWALGAYLLFPPGDFAHQMFLAFVLAGLAAGGANSLASDFVSAMGYTIPPLIMLAVILSIQSTALYHTMAGMVLLLMIYLLATGKRTQGILLETSRLRIKDQRLSMDLHAGQQNLRSILDNTPIGIWRQDKDGRLLFVNRWFCDSVGIPEERFLSVAHYGELYEATMAQRCIDSDMAAYVAAGPQLSHEQVTFVDGQPHDLEITKFRLENEDGEIDGLIGLATDRTEAHRLDRERRENEMRLRQIISHSLDAIISMNHLGIITGWNPEAERIFGYQARQAIGRDLAELIVPPALREAHRHGLRRFLETGQAKVLGSRIEVTALRADGTEFPIELSISAPELQGHARFFSAFIRDLTEQNRTRDRLASSLQQLQAILDNVADAIVTIDTRGVVQSFNQAAEKSFGYAAAEVIGNNIRMLMPEPHHTRHDAYIQRYLNTGVPHIIGTRREVEGQRKDGTLFPISLAVSAVERDGHPLFVGLIHDISESKRIEGELQSGKEAAQHALNTLRQQKFALDQHAIVAITDVRGHILYVNDKFCQISGYSREELMGQDHKIVNSGHHPHGFFREMYKTVSRGQVWHAEICNRAKNGHLYWVDTTIVPFLDEQGKPEQYIAIRADITERKQAEAELLQHRDHLQSMILEQTKDLRLAKDAAERANQAKSEFLANMSHELRTPMHAILSFSELGESRIDSVPPDKLQGYFQRIHASGERLLDLLNDLLDLSKLEAGKMQLELAPHDLLKLAEEPLAEFGVLAASRQLHLVLAPCPFDTTTQVDAKRFGQIVRNLLSNAIKFTPAGGTVTVAFQAAIMPKGRRASDSGMEPAIAMEIHDSGIGIPEDELESVFDKFVQSSKTKSSAGGTGLGLAICKEMVEAHRGTITAHNNPGGGATFTVTLPLIDTGADA